MTHDPQSQSGRGGEHPGARGDGRDGDAPRGLIATIIRYVATILLTMAVLAIVSSVIEAVGSGAKAASESFANAQRNSAKALAQIGPDAAESIYWAAFEGRNGAPSPVEERTGVHVGHWASSIAPLIRFLPNGIAFALAAPIAMADLIWHLLFGDGGSFIGRVVVATQLALGAAMTMMVMRFLFGRAEGLNGFEWFIRIAVFCFGTVFLASATAYLGLGVLERAEAAFGALSHAAATSTYFGGAWGFIIAFATTGGEGAVHKRVESIVEKI